MPKRKTDPSEEATRKKTTSIRKTQNQWTDPNHRGIHEDAIAAGRAPNSAAACVACGQKIKKGHCRWGIKYAGNPLPIAAIPLYGSHPMFMWCHGGNGCGLAFARYGDMTSEPPAARTCHACQDAPDEVAATRDVSVSSADPAAIATAAAARVAGGQIDRKNIRLICGGPPKGCKIRHHVFHISCWIRCVRKSCGGNDADPSLLRQLLLKPQDLVAKTHKKSASGLMGLSWGDLTPDERHSVRVEFQQMGVPT